MPTPSQSLRPEWDAVWTHVAEAVSARSLCTRARVGACVVDIANRIVAVGYNNPPAGFDHRDLPCTEWCQRAMPLQPDGLTDNGCGYPERYELYKGKRYIGDASRGVELTDEMLLANGWTYTYPDPDPTYDDCPSLHAETNALSVCDRSQREGGTIYVTSHVCHACAKLIANSGLARVVVSTSAAADATHRQPERSYDLLRGCGLTVDVDLW
jgi:deoxycytidylate deaminase